MSSYYRPKGEVGERVMSWMLKKGYAERVYVNDPLSQFINFGLDQLERGIASIVNHALKDKEKDSE